MTQTVSALSASTYVSTISVDDKKDNKSSSTSLKEFMENLRYFLIDKDASTKEVIEEVYKTAPPSLKLDEIADLVFEECSESDILRILNALTKEKGYTLSPLNTVRNAILEDIDKLLLTNQSLKELLTKHKLGNDEKALAACEDFAFRMNLFRSENSRYCK